MGNTVTASISSPDTGPTAPEKPEASAEAWRPEGFTGTQEDLAKSWRDQRAEITRLQQGKKKPAEPAPHNPGIAEDSDDPAELDTMDQSPDPASADEKPDGQDAAADKVLKTAGFDVSTFQAEYDTSGDVSPASREKIAKGLEKVLGPDARQLVDDYVESKKVVHANDFNLYMDAAGGKDRYADMMAWAKESLTPEQKNAYNRAVNSRDRASALLAIEGLNAKYTSANGRAPRLVRPSGSASTGTKGFASSAEMTAAMRDPRYKTDPAYRAQVAERLAASDF